MEGTNPLTFENIILGLAAYFSPVDFLSNKNRVMRCGLKVRQYAARLIDLKEYLDSFPGGKLSLKNWRDGAK